MYVYIYIYAHALTHMEAEKGPLEAAVFPKPGASQSFSLLLCGSVGCEAYSEPSPKPLNPKPYIPTPQPQNP